MAGGGAGQQPAGESAADLYALAEAAVARQRKVEALLPRPESGGPAASTAALGRPVPAERSHSAPRPLPVLPAAAAAARPLPPAPLQLQQPAPLTVQIESAAWDLEERPESRGSVAGSIGGASAGSSEHGYSAVIAGY